jgi:hypothetical protein
MIEKKKGRRRDIEREGEIRERGERDRELKHKHKHIYLGDRLKRQVIYYIL